MPAKGNKTTLLFRRFVAYTNVEILHSTKAQITPYVHPKVSSSAKTYLVNMQKIRFYENEVSPDKDTCTGVKNFRKETHLAALHFWSHYIRISFLGNLHKCYLGTESGFTKNRVRKGKDDANGILISFSFHII